MVESKTPTIADHQRRQPVKPWLLLSILAGDFLAGAGLAAAILNMMRPI